MEWGFATCIFFQVCQKGLRVHRVRGGRPSGRARVLLGAPHVRAARPQCAPRRARRLSRRLQELPARRVLLQKRSARPCCPAVGWAAWFLCSDIRGSTHFCETGISFVAVIQGDKGLCSVSNYVELTSPEGSIANVVTHETGCGSHSAPWVIKAMPGQVRLQEKKRTVWDSCFTIKIPS